MESMSHWWIYSLPQLEDLNRQHLWFQQDGATPHTSIETMAIIRATFPGRLISRFGDVPYGHNGLLIKPLKIYSYGYTLKERFTSILALILLTRITRNSIIIASLPACIFYDNNFSLHTDTRVQLFTVTCVDFYKSYRCVRVCVCECLHSAIV